MERQTFILLDTKWYRTSVHLFIKDSSDKIEKRAIHFTTEHKINEKDRSKPKTKKIPAEFSTSDERVIDAIYRDTGYGIAFVNANDPKGERKKEPFNITPLDSKKIALKNLFEAAGMDFDDKKSVEVLTEEYQIYTSAKEGVEIKGSPAIPIIHQEVDVHQEMINAANKAKELYEEKYGEEVPAEYKDDLGFLSALADPDFDAKGYIAKNSKVEKVEETEEVTIDSDSGLPSDIPSLQQLYLSELGKNAPNPKKNDADWLAKEILKNRQ